MALSSALVGQRALLGKKGFCYGGGEFSVRYKIAFPVLF